MMWEYVRFEDDTQVSYSDVQDDNTVLVVIERPKDRGFDTASVSCQPTSGLKTMDLANKILLG